MTDDNILKFPVIEGGKGKEPVEAEFPPAAPDIVSALEELLAMAQSGRMRTFAIAFVTADMCTCDGWSGSEHPHLLMAATSYLHRRLPEREDLQRQTTRGDSPEDVS